MRTFAADIGAKRRGVREIVQRLHNSVRCLTTASVKLAADKSAEGKLDRQDPLVDNTGTVRDNTTTTCDEADYRRVAGLHRITF